VLVPGTGLFDGSNAKEKAVQHAMDESDGRGTGAGEG
jgi:hypothetical protein